MFSVALAMTSLLAAAQDAYESSRLLGNDLNGTARYVGMGGAMEALGAEISTMSTNPAGIGLFRHSSVSASMGIVSQSGVDVFDDLGKTNVSFDQAGFVYSTQLNRTSFVNFGINYHKSRNFDQILSASMRAGQGAAMNSLNKLTYMKNSLGNSIDGGYDLAFQTDNAGKIIGIMGYESWDSGDRAQTFTQFDYLNANAVLWDHNDNKLYYSDANGYDFNRSHRGSISDVDVNLSGNVGNRVYLGMTLGLHNVNYLGFTEYTEHMVNSQKVPTDDIHYSDERKITGMGFDINVGAIFRPVEESPFRVGVYIATPTWYELTTENHTEVWGKGFRGKNSAGYDEYKFKLFTPWRFGLSLGHTIGNSVALGATYDYSGYSSTDVRVNTGRNDYGDMESVSDRVMNANVTKSLKGVSTLKVGVELKPVAEVAVRAGYNYVSPMYSAKGMRDTQISSNGVMYASTADYTNWKATNRFTCGLGYKTGGFNVDLAYQYNMTKGDFYPFQNKVTYLDEYGTMQETTDFSKATEVSFKRHQIMLTLGYTF